MSTSLLLNYITKKKFKKGCLAASYIGGTVNFFATARILSKQLEIMNNSVGMNNLLSAMAAADLIVMALYFGILTKLMSWSRLYKWFPPREKREVVVQNNNNNNNTLSLQKESHIIMNSLQEKEKKKMRIRYKNISKIPSILAMITVAWTIVEVSNILETYTSSFIPGMQCAFVALFGSIVNHFINHLSSSSSSSRQQRKSNNGNGVVVRFFSQFKSDVCKFAPSLSDYCFYLLFATIGTSANLKKALTYGLPCIIFASMSLIIHIFTIFLGSSIITIVLDYITKRTNFLKFIPLVNKLQKLLSRLLPLSCEEICIASNAAIGGASTAAALAGKTKIVNRNGLVIAATFWGILGYAVSTTIGVWLSKSLFLKIVNVN